MKKRVYALLCTAVVFAFVFTACIDDKMDPCPVGGDVHLTLSLLAGNPQTKAVVEVPGIDDFNENMIDQVDLFFYEGATLIWHAAGADNNFDAATNMLVIPVPEAFITLFDGFTGYNIYVVANNTADLSTIVEGEDNLEALSNLVMQTPAFQTDGGVNPQASFVMDGTITRNVNVNSPDLGTVNLKRAASKICLTLVDVDVEGYSYTLGAAEARLVHFTDQSVLLDGGTTYVPQTDVEWLNTEYRALSSVDTTVVPFYAYANDWSTDAARETFLELKVPLVDDASDVSKDYFYHIPITPQDPDGDDAGHMNRMERNFFYDIQVKIGLLGGEEEDPVEIEGNYKIIDWSTKESLIDIRAFDFLVLSEYNVVMPNITDYEINFFSSIPDVWLVDGSLKVSYTYVDHNNAATPTTVQIGSRDRQWPSVTVDPNVADGIITITSAIPENYFPKDIVFQVTNGSLTDTVTIQQLPATYFTAERGERSYHLPDGNWVSESPPQRNRYMYIITTLAPDGQIIWGFPPVDGYGRTENSLETSRMVSPRFMMASQLGARLPSTRYNTALSNCFNYYETTMKNGVEVEYRGWRLPTEAEIKYIDNLQNNTQLGIVMHGLYYWDAYSPDGATRMQGGVNEYAGIRCIRDIKD